MAWLFYFYSSQFRSLNPTKKVLQPVGQLGKKVSSQALANILIKKKTQEQKFQLIHMKYTKRNPKSKQRRRRTKLRSGDPTVKEEK